MLRNIDEDGVRIDEDVPNNRRKRRLGAVRTARYEAPHVAAHDDQDKSIGRNRIAVRSTARAQRSPG
jgi:hypothetical protein